MNYAWARDYTLELIHQYTIAGAPVALSYNNQADYVARIPKLLNDAQLYVAAGPRRIRAAVPVTALGRVRFGPHLAYTMPEDFWQMTSNGLISFREGKAYRFHRYHLLGNNLVALDEPVPEPLILEYYRYPILLSGDPEDGEELDNTLEVQQALPFYAAAHLVMLDNAFAYSALYNEFEAKLARFQEVPQTEYNEIEDRYGTDGWEDYGTCM